MKTFAREALAAEEPRRGAALHGCKEQTRKPPMTITRPKTKVRIRSANERSLSVSRAAWFGRFLILSLQVCHSRYHQRRWTLASAGYQPLALSAALRPFQFTQKDPAGSDLRLLVDIRMNSFALTFLVRGFIEHVTIQQSRPSHLMLCPHYQHNVCFASRLGLVQSQQKRCVPHGENVQRNCCSQDNLK